ncbi:class I SAM-dependent methyltransferase, partial [Polaromonas sp.]
MKDIDLHGLEAASIWVQRWSHLVKPGGTVLDVACGHGRHSRWFYEQNHPVVAVDRAQAAIESIANTIPAGACETVVADIESGPWPFTGRQFDAVVATNYLWRPLIPTLLA